MLFLDNIRRPKKSKSIKKQIVVSFGVLLFGICLGLFSKYLDYRQAELPPLLQGIDNALDLHNFLGGFAPWIVIALCISIYSNSSIRASINVFLFFLGFVAFYYLYSNFVAGFFPKSYALIWIIFTIISPILAYLTWYAKGKGYIAIIISAGIISVLINLAFSYGMFYIDIQSWLNLVMLMLGIFILRKSFKETLSILGLAVVFAVIIEFIVPYKL